MYHWIADASRDSDHAATRRLRSRRHRRNRTHVSPRPVARAHSFPAGQFMRASVATRTLGFCAPFSLPVALASSAACYAPPRQ